MFPDDGRWQRVLLHFRVREACWVICCHIPMNTMKLIAGGGSALLLKLM